MQLFRMILIEVIADPNASILSISHDQFWVGIAHECSVFESDSGDSLKKLVFIRLLQIWSNTF
jgi:hypothetical protein